VIAWRARYDESGIGGLVDRPRSGRPRGLDHGEIVSATLRPPPPKLGVTHWSSRLLADRAHPFVWTKTADEILKNANS
jgi:hypothetical protein